MNVNKKKVAVLFGGRSPEHEVSIITGIQIMNALNKDKYDVLPVYISKDGKWICGDGTFLDPITFRDLDTAVKNKKIVVMSSDPGLKGLIEEPSGIGLAGSFKSKTIDIVFPAFHGRYGEDGSVQGLLEMSNIPYVGCDVQTSAIGMDKVVSKKVAKSIGIPVLNDCRLNKSAWESDKSEFLNKIKNSLKFPVFVKPARLGSSIGINKAKNVKELEDAVEVAFFYDTKVMVEESLENAREVNISILGNDPYEVSVCEMPVPSGEVLSFEDKYTSKKGVSKGMATSQRLIPAPVKDSTRRKIEEYARKFFSEIGGQGIARVDFLISRDEKQIYLNEINTLPGSVAYYLWKENGINFTELTDKLIDLGFERFEEKNKLITTFKSNILSGFSGTKEIKG
jgi:D-alanine-D-alanine ligase